MSDLIPYQQMVMLQMFDGERFFIENKSDTMEKLKKDLETQKFLFIENKNEFIRVNQIKKVKMNTEYYVSLDSDQNIELQSKKIAFKEKLGRWPKSVEVQSMVKAILEQGNEHLTHKL